ncbi:hypothetical protein CHOTACABRAS_172 [Bacillus phage Chotacabras]|nr:hypothetical protein CHOTACABRAS_172 [Bacillus phage Chotacabras]
MPNNQKVVAKWYKKIDEKIDLVIHTGGSHEVITKLKRYPSDEEIAVALDLFGGHRAEVVTTTVETKPYNVIGAGEVEDYYKYNDELKSSSEHIIQTDEIRQAVVARMKEDDGE